MIRNTVNSALVKDEMSCGCGVLWLRMSGGLWGGVNMGVVLVGLDSLSWDSWRGNTCCIMFLSVWVNIGD